MSKIKQRLEHALKYNYPVRIVFKGCVRDGLVAKVHDAKFIMEKGVANGAKHNYSAVISVEPLIEDTVLKELFIEQIALVVKAKGDNGKSFYKVVARHPTPHCMIEGDHMELNWKVNFKWETDGTFTVHLNAMD